MLTVIFKSFSCLYTHLLFDFHIHTFLLLQIPEWKSILFGWAPPPFAGPVKPSAWGRTTTVYMLNKAGYYRFASRACLPSCGFVCVLLVHLISHRRTKCMFTLLSCCDWCSLQEKMGHVGPLATLKQSFYISSTLHRSFSSTFLKKSKSYRRLEIICSFGRWAKFWQPIPLCATRTLNQPFLGRLFQYSVFQRGPNAVRACYKHLDFLG